MRNTVIDKLLTEVEKAEKKNIQKQRAKIPWLGLTNVLLFFLLVVLFLLIFPVVLYLENIYLVDNLDISLLSIIAVADIVFIILLGLFYRSVFTNLPDASESVCEHLENYLDSHYTDVSKVVELVMSELSKEREDAQKRFESIVKIVSLLPMLFFTNVIPDFMKNLVEDKDMGNSYRVVLLLFLVYLLSRGVGYIIVSYIKNPTFGKGYKKICLYNYLSVVKYKVLEKKNSIVEQ